MSHSGMVARTLRLPPRVGTGWRSARSTGATNSLGELFFMATDIPLSQGRRFFYTGSDSLLQTKRGSDSPADRRVLWSFRQ